MYLCQNFALHEVCKQIPKSIYQASYLLPSDFFLKLGFTPCKAEQPLQGMELQEKKTKKDNRIQKICLERTYI